MRSFFRYFLAYGRQTPRTAFWLTVAFLGALITLNYTVGIEGRIKGLGPWWVQWGCFAVFYTIVMTVAWAAQRTAMPVGLLRLLALAPLYFAAKMIHWDLPGYWGLIGQWPAKGVLLLLLLWLVWKAGWLGASFGFREAFGCTTDNFRPAPYFGLLALLIPVVALASTQPDFLRVYPRVMHVAALNEYPGPLWLRAGGFELSYGLDFLSIELFFRGLLVIAVARYAGEKAILPMAALYCTIHFGKPLGECLTSFIGGMALGVLAYRTRTIAGGLIVHLGLAWLMEIGGWLGH